MRFNFPSILAGCASSPPTRSSVYGGSRMGFVQNCTSYRPILGDILIDIGRPLIAL